MKLNKTQILDLVDKVPGIIVHLKDATDEVLAAGLKRDPNLIVSIDNPSKRLQEQVVKDRPEMILALKDPSQKLKELAIEEAIKKLVENLEKAFDKKEEDKKDE